jgi:hypothetical protein
MSIPRLHRSSTRSVAARLALVVGFSVVIGATVGGSVPAFADTCPTSNPPNELTLVGGSPQTAKLHQPFGEPLQVALANTNGCLVTTNDTGVAVSFTAPSSGATGTFAVSGANTVTVGTNASGQASASGFTANSNAGSYAVTASSNYGSISLSLTNTASGVAATITAGTPVSQSATAGDRYAQPLQATVLDANGNPIDGATVTFTLGTSGGAGAAVGASAAGASFAGGASQVTELTNAAGTATSPLFTANATAGTFTATAATDGVVEPASFMLANLTGAPPTITALTPVKQSAAVGARYGKPLQVKVLNGSGHALQGTSVTFTLGSSTSAGSAGGSSSSSAGASFVGGSSQATETTNDGGVATSPRFLANTTAGSFTATATTSGISKAVSFALHNLAGKPATITAGVAATESTAVRTRFPVRLAVTVGDKYGNPIAGVRVTFIAPSHGASGRFGGKKRAVKVKTDAKGVAVAPRFVANHIQGGYVVRARAAGHSAAFALVNQPAA